MEIIEQFSEEISFLRKYAYEYSQALDSDTFDLMIKSQVALHIMFESQQAEITRLNAVAEKLKSGIAMYHEAVRESSYALPDLIANTEIEYTQQAKNYEGYPAMTYKYDYLMDEAKRGRTAYALCKEALSEDKP